MKYFLIACCAAFTVFLYGCENSSENSSYYFPSSGQPDNMSGSQPGDRVPGVAYLKNGSSGLSSDGYGALDVLTYYVPAIATDAAVSSDRYKLNITGTSGAALYAGSSSVRKEEKHDFHSGRRDLEEEYLVSGAVQYSPGSSYRKISRAVNLGDVWTGAYVSRNVDDSHVSIDAVCFAISDKAYFFVERGLTVTPEIEKLFDNYTVGFDSMYPAMHDNFGTENDVDGNGKIVILFYNSTSPGLYGYFSAADKYPLSPLAPYSNESDMFYVNYNYVTEENDILGTLIHEFQHMILFDARYNMGYSNLKTWINEGLSVLAEYLTGYADKQQFDYVAQFVSAYNYPYLSLTEWTDYSYGYSGIFLRYLYERWGIEAVEKLYASEETGVKAVEEATGNSFNSTFKDFALALLISGRGFTPDSRYNFSTIDIPSYDGNGGNTGLGIFELKSVGDYLEREIKPYGLQLTRWRGDAVTAYLNSVGTAGFAVSAR